MTSESRESAGESAAPPSGDERVDEALGALSGLAGRPVHEHVGVFQVVHQRLAEILGSGDGDQETEVE